MKAKSSDWGFPDAFKVRGWMEYVGTKDGALFVSTDISKNPKFFLTSAAFGVRFVHLGDFTDAIQRFNSAGFPAINDPACVELWRWSYWAERELIRDVSAWPPANRRHRILLS